MATPKQEKFKLTAEIMEGFVASCLVKDYDQATKIPGFHKELWDLFCLDHPNVAVAAPRRHAKTTAGTQAYTLANILFRQRFYVVIVSDTETQAVQFLGDIKSVLLDNEDIHNLFGAIKIIKDREADFVGAFEDGTEFRIQAKGAEQKVRGLKWESKRPDLICIDDLENDELVMNQDRRTKLKRWFYGALLPARAKHGIVRYVGTILHMDSLLEGLMHRYRPKTIDSLRSVNKDTRKAWITAKYRAHNEDFTELLWPENYTPQYFKDLKEEHREQGLLDVYSQEYLNFPMDPSVAFYRKDDFIRMSNDDKDSRKVRYVGVDLAISERERADYSVFTVAGVDEHNILHVEDVIRIRTDAKGIIDTLMELQVRYQPDLFIIEQGHINKTIGPFLRAEMLESGIFLNVEPMQPIGDKQSRARSIQARFRAGTIRVNKEADWYNTWEEELLQFPRGRHDDQVDSLSYIGLGIDKFVSAETQEEVDEEEYLEEFGYNTDPISLGANRYCGY